MTPPLVRQGWWSADGCPTVGVLLSPIGLHSRRTTRCPLRHRRSLVTTEGNSRCVRRPADGPGMWPRPYSSARRHELDTGGQTREHGPLVVIQVSVLVMGLVYAASLLPGVRGGSGYSLKLDGWVNNLFIAGVVVRSSPSRSKTSRTDERGGASRPRWPPPSAGTSPTTSTTSA